MERPLTDRKINYHFTLSMRNASFTGNPQDGVINTNVEKVVKTDTKDRIFIPSSEEFKDIIQSASIDLEKIQKLSGQAIIANDTPVVELGFIAHGPGGDDNVFLEELEHAVELIEKRVHSEFNVKWSRLETNEGGKLGGPRPFSSNEFDIAIVFKDSIQPMTEMDCANLEAKISEEAEDGPYAISPDIFLPMGDSEMITLKTRTEELHEDYFYDMMDSIKSYATVKGTVVDKVWIMTEGDE